MKIYCAINEIFFDEEECIKYVNEYNKKNGEDIDYCEANVRFHHSKNSDDIVIKPMYDDDKYATEVSCGETRILPPENHLVGTVTQTERGFVVEFIDKSKLA